MPRRALTVLRGPRDCDTGRDFKRFKTMQTLNPFSSTPESASFKLRSQQCLLWSMRELLYSFSDTPEAKYKVSHPPNHGIGSPTPPLPSIARIFAPGLALDRMIVAFSAPSRDEFHVTKPSKCGSVVGE